MEQVGAKSASRRQLVKTQNRWGKRWRKDDSYCRMVESTPKLLSQNVESRTCVLWTCGSGQDFQTEYQKGQLILFCFFNPHVLKYEKRALNFKKKIVKFQPDFRRTIKKPELSGFKNKLPLILTFIQEKVLKGPRAKTTSRAPPEKHGLRQRPQECRIKIPG